jgi:hypothetical protein
VWMDLHQRGNRVLNRARQLVPVDTGTLRASLTMEHITVGGAPAVRIGSSLPYAIYRHEGTGIYGPKGAPIRPKSGKYLRWPATNNSGAGRRRYSGGATAAYVFARQVKGTPGVAFLLDALPAAGG